MKKTMLIPITLLIIAFASPVFATGGTGQIRIMPQLPIALSSPATFNVSVTTGESFDPHLLLVMTNACYNGLSGDVVATWAGGSVTFLTSDFAADNTNGNKVPPGTTNGADYTVASLKSHLNVADAVYWACKPFLSGPITTSPTSFTITFTSTSPKMLVYALGKSNQTASLFDMKVPNTIPGFILPELATVLLATGSFAALGLYAIKRRKK